ncbi:short-chain dehydrogenase/reductase 10 isoform a [Thecamonas trahens ATCC 50062]|uniref:Short-chain dehydrogenase/reductase 10 isoform a n=1 Tax=Thecamonas trahens ATCC 50062 TaxID=461836 RepID=A0A0L0DUV1_THETB|nr:short-chain dehydrogenase/reductase 10 isoform a [Thecamonas trahens ATCC 50062]KNC55851.1 short-chain dehydrogenase/reductase 10 isoform a [Thecamonas trahens ATCC 50062]|eukprot:XP_013752777.1 short-chain dehydrogenase/reductase 10 isoform a [Thecamonas trahens ATCC 50062]
MTMGGIRAAVAGLAGQWVVVCGASKGIGRALVLALAASGANVVAVARSAPALADVAAEARRVAPGPPPLASIVTVVADLADEDAVARLMAVELPPIVGPAGVRMLILNHVAGWWQHWLAGPDGSHVARLAAAQGAGVDGVRVTPTLRALFAVNFDSYVAIATHAMGLLLAAGDAGSRAQLVVVSSVAGKIGLPKVPPYAAAKHALHGFFESLRHELDMTGAPLGITMAMLGNIDTAANRTNTAGEVAHLPYASPHDAAAAIIAAAASGTESVTFPWAQIQPVIWLDMLIPRLARTIIQRATYGPGSFVPSPTSIALPSPDVMLGADRPKPDHPQTVLT